MKKQHKYWYRYRKKSRLGSIGIGIENTRLVWYRLGLGLDAKIMVSPYSIQDRLGPIQDRLGPFQGRLGPNQARLGLIQGRLRCIRGRPGPIWG